MARPPDIVPDVVDESPVVQEKMSTEATSTTENTRLARWRRWFFPSSSSSKNAHSLASDDGIRGPRKVVAGLPRHGTFKRQQSELRDKLRTVSEDRRRTAYPRSISANVASSTRISAPELMGTVYMEEVKKEISQTDINGVGDVIDEAQEPDPDAISDTSSIRSIADTIREELFKELEQRWILNLSMHFRDKSNREKFFITFAETPNHWRRVTLSLDYRGAEQGSLEYDLQHTRFQRDKSARIYESIRESLQDIQFFDTVTNLKLQTDSDRLHVHVTEDVHEIISYPPISAIQHLDCRQVREEEVHFDSHLSGFVYKVTVGSEVFIKKEIPGPDTVEEFLYEINALKQLSGSACVISFGGVIVDNEGKFVKGLLISHAEQGALVDILYDLKGDLPWYRRQRWAKQIVQGLSEIHEAGFVQGDFTLSNIVIDGDDNAKIIDINRRGCPVGWEPPEVAALISSSQRISMYIGVKSDLFQLGMVLWAIAMEQDEPEIYQKPLDMCSAPGDVPHYFRDIVDACLSENPRHRVQASKVLEMFPYIQETSGPVYSESVTSLPRSMEEYPDPTYAVDRNDIDEFRGGMEFDPIKIDRSHTYVETADEPYFYPNRGRRGRSLSPRPADGNSPAPQTLYVLPPSIGDTSKKPSHSDHEFTNDGTFDRHIRIVSPPSPPPTAEQWIEPPSSIYLENNKPLHTHIHDLNLDSTPAHILEPQPESPRTTAAEETQPLNTSSNSYLKTNNNSAKDHSTDLFGVGAHHNDTTDFFVAGARAGLDSDILSDLPQLTLHGSGENDNNRRFQVEGRREFELHIDDDDDDVLDDNVITKTTMNMNTTSTMTNDNEVKGGGGREEMN